MGEDPGEDKFVLKEYPGGVHWYVSFDWYKPERPDTMGKIAAWLEDGMRADQTSVRIVVRLWIINLPTSLSTRYPNPSQCRYSSSARWPV